MKHFVKTFSIISSLLLTFSLLGCSNQETARKVEKEVKPARTVVENESKTVNPEQKKKEEKKSPSAQSNNTAQAAAKAATSTSSNTSSSTTVSSKPAVTATKTTAATKTTTSTPAASKTSTPAKTQSPATTVTISVIGPKDRGTIIGASSVSISEGDTIYDVLEKVAKKHNIFVDSSGSGASTYIQGIDNIYAEGKNGWVFKLNGESITKSTGVIKVKDGDRIECYYTE